MIQHILLVYNYWLIRYINMESEFNIL
jgi:hypothetical protein